MSNLYTISAMTKIVIIISCFLRVILTSFRNVILAIPNEKNICTLFHRYVLIRLILWCNIRYYRMCPRGFSQSDCDRLSNLYHRIKAFHNRYQDIELWYQVYVRKVNSFQWKGPINILTNDDQQIPKLFETLIYVNFIQPCLICFWDLKKDFLVQIIILLLIIMKINFKS